jgi:hypothetical protein
MVESADTTRCRVRERATSFTSEASSLTYSGASSAIWARRDAPASMSQMASSEDRFLRIESGLVRSQLRLEARDASFRRNDRVELDAKRRGRSLERLVDRRRSERRGALRLAELDGARRNAEDLLRRRRLHEIGDDAEPNRFDRALRGRRRRHHDARDVFVVRPHDVEDVDARRARQVQVREDGVERRRRHLRDGLFRRTRGLDDVAFAREEPRQRVCEALVVLHEEQRAGSGLDERQSNGVVHGRPPVEGPPRCKR